MPFGGTDIRHGLDDEVFGHQGLTQSLGLAANRFVAGCQDFWAAQCLRVGCWGRSAHHFSSEKIRPQRIESSSTQAGNEYRDGMIVRTDMLNRHGLAAIRATTYL